jgi:hypothetical protein
MSDRMRWGSGSDWDNDGWGGGWGGGCAPCPPAPCPPPVCTTQPCPPVAMPPCPPPWFGPPRPPWYPGASGGVSFGTTPPQFPIRGHFWWDGALLHMWDGVEWETIGPTPPSAGGGVVATTTVIFGMTNSTNATVPTAAGGWGIIPFVDSPNPLSMATWDAAQHKLTPTKPGVYACTIRGGGSPAGGIALLKNDPGTFLNTFSDIMIAIATNTSSSGWLSSAGFATMNGTTDFLRMWAWGSDGIYHSVGSNQCFTVALLP